jgi:hypothetical protein
MRVATPQHDGRIPVAQDIAASGYTDAIVMIFND